MNLRKLTDNRKTYTGLGISLFGVLGLTHFFTTEGSEKIVTLVVELAGLAIAAYGRYDREHRV